MARILVIDDEPAIRKTIGNMLRVMKHEVLEAENGQIGVETARLKAPDMVITDMIMPQKEGIETIIEIKRNHPDMKVIAVSGGGRIKKVDILEIARRAGADAAIVKPFSLADLQKTIETLLGDSQKGSSG